MYSCIVLVVITSKEDARFCGHCGYKLTQESKTNVVPKDLFSIDEIQTSSAATDQSATDEDFFDNSNNPLIEDSEESGWVDDRKVFSEEDDPTIIDEEPTTKIVSTKKLDSKTRAKLKVKNVQVRHCLVTSSMEFNHLCYY